MKEVHTLDEQRRIDVGRELFAMIGGEITKGETIEVWALIGGAGQLQLLPRDSRLSVLRDQFEKQTVDTDWDAAGDEKVAIYTKLQSFLRVTCRARKSGLKIRITLPSEAVKFGYVVDRGTVSVVTNGRILEIWNSGLWQQGGKVSDLRSFTQAAEKALEESD